jgi:hypothetical protein
LWKKRLETGNLCLIGLSLGDGSVMLRAHMLTHFDIVQTIANRSNKEQRIGSLIMSAVVCLLVSPNDSFFIITVTATQYEKVSHDVGSFVRLQLHSLKLR